MQIQILVGGLPVESTAYRAGEGFIIHIPDIARKVGEWDGKAYEYEGGLGAGLRSLRPAVYRTAGWNDGLPAVPGQRRHP
jgi:hypothetical protein